MHDELILQLMPAWIPLKHLASIASGLVLLGGGTCIALGILVDWAGAMLAAFLVTVTLLIHVPGMLAQLRRALRPDGLFLAALLGGETLTELRQSLAEAEAEITGGAAPRVLAGRLVPA